MTGTLDTGEHEIFLGADAGITGDARASKPVGLPELASNIIMLLWCGDPSHKPLLFF